ncbi:glycosyltransferase family 2 protein [Desulfovibrio piger]|uniref:glycosyltransferase family 2 protein n=1 Tax=Desulfovibrio piger TaxID=901 RepID=UPI0026661894|nr:glycosyltransferase family 2 protein [Desulfovibrio piger]
MPSSKGPAVSVIIPVRNSGRYFRECLDSVTGQTLRNIEIIIIDDASTDGSDAVAEAYAAQDSRITIIHHDESTGAGPARNDGMAIAKGEYIAFMDSDDLYPSMDTLTVLYQKAIQQHAKICGGSLYKIDTATNTLSYRIPDQYFEQEGWIYYTDYQYEGGFTKFLYSKLFLLNNKLEFPALKRFQDPVFFVNTMILAKKFYAVPAQTYAYRKTHKMIYWSHDKIFDHLRGVKYLLGTSSKYNLKKLHYNMAKNLLDFLHYKLNFFQKLINIGIIYETYRSIKWDLLILYPGNVHIKKYKYFLYFFRSKTNQL